ncbi:arginyl-tRNA synthetase [Ceratocystis pirilliformis]|uniref:arginine--tRNA ligase n=1 Tax=Ceratocystis pirilliformis TaxID=259994 RepID=A0ABR3YUT7_9PEZI
MFGGASRLAAAPLPSRLSISSLPLPSACFKPSRCLRPYTSAVSVSTSALATVQHYSHSPTPLATAPPSPSALPLHRYTGRHARRFTTSRFVSFKGKMVAVDQLSGLLAKLPINELESYPNWFPAENPVDIYRSHITSLLHEVSGVDKKIIYPALQWTTGLDKGDLLVAVPALRVKGKKPTELAEEWVSKFPESPLVEKPVAFNHFLQFFFKPGPLVKLVLPMIQARGVEYGQNNKLGLTNVEDESQGRKRIIVEFSSPNIAKPFHAGHLRSTIIGGFLGNLYAGAGWDVTRMNYLGDWGKQYGLLALGFEKYGDEEALKTDPINHLYHIYVKINADKSAEDKQIADLTAVGKTEEATKLKEEGTDEQARKYFKLMSDGDAAALAQWQRFRDMSIMRYKETYARLNIAFDEFSGESQVKQDAMEEAATALIEKGIAEESDKALIIDFTKHVPGKAGKSLEKPIIRKRDGTALYLTRDISELLRRHDQYNFDQMIYVVASAQDLHLKQLFKIIELMGHTEIAKKVQHVNFGLVLGMSTRKGTVVFLDDILREVGDHMHEVMKKNEDKYKQVENPKATADILGISSVMVQDMTGKRINNYEFDMEAMTSFEGDTGPYLQYAHARLASIGRKARAASDVTDAEVAAANWDLLSEPHAKNLVRLLGQYPDVFVNTIKTLEPTTVLTYLFKMTHVLSSSYDVLRVVGSEKDLLVARLALYESAKQVLGNGMRLLGLSPVERM